MKHILKATMLAISPESQSVLNEEYGIGFDEIRNPSALSLPRRTAPPMAKDEPERRQRERDNWIKIMEDTDKRNVSGRDRRRNNQFRNIKSLKKK